MIRPEMRAGFACPVSGHGLLWMIQFTPPILPCWRLNGIQAGDVQVAVAVRCTFARLTFYMPLPIEGTGSIPGTLPDARPLVVGITANHGSYACCWLFSAPTGRMHPDFNLTPIPVHRPILGLNHNRGDGVMSRPSGWHWASPSPINDIDTPAGDLFTAGIVPLAPVNRCRDCDFLPLSVCNLAPMLIIGRIFLSRT